MFYESPLQKVPETRGITMQEAIYQFVFEKNKVVQIDTAPWP
jgi:translation elongation factor EF-G